MQFVCTLFYSGNIGNWSKDDYTTWVDDIKMYTIYPFGDCDRLLICFLLLFIIAFYYLHEV